MAKTARVSGNGLLSPLQRIFLQLFSTIPDQAQFYLTGGTALAEFYLGHRISFDLDLFTGSESLVLPVSYQIEKLGSGNFKGLRVIRRFNTYVEFQITGPDEELKVDLALDSPFRFQSPSPSEFGVLINDRQDIYTDKILAYYGRAEPRDAVDLYFILQEVNADELLSLASKKDPGFDLYWFSIALNRCADFPDEIENWPVKMVKPFEPMKLKAEFQALAMNLMRRIKS